MSTSLGHYRKLRCVGACLVLCIPFLWLACGYRVMQTQAPFGQHTLCVLPFLETSANGLSQPLAQALMRRLAAGGAALTHDAAAADAVFSGHIEVRDQSTTTLRSVQMYTVLVRVYAQLRTTAGQILWEHTLELSDNFLPTDPALQLQPLVTEARRRTALLRAAEQAAAQLQEALARTSDSPSSSPAPPEP